MNKEEILNRLIQKSICINAGGKGCYSPYTNDMDWFSDIDNLILMCEQLQRDTQKYKEVIDKSTNELFILKDMIYKPETREENFEIQRKISSIIKRLNGKEVSE